MKQIEDKHRREEERLRREKEEELLIEKRLNEQRLRLLKEFEEEQRQQKLKADSLARKQEIITEMISGKKTPKKSSDTERHEDVQTNLGPHRKSITPVKPKLPRSPSYLHIRHPKSPGNRKSHPSLESRSIQEEITAMTSPSSVRTSNRLRKVAQSPKQKGLGGDEIQSNEPAKYQPPDPVELEKINLSSQIESNKNTQSKGNIALSRLWLNLS